MGLYTPAPAVKVRQSQIDVDGLMSDPRIRLQLHVSTAPVGAIGC